MIIGISGKKQSGKDTVCKIIQYLIASKEDKLIPFEEIQSIWDKEEQHNPNCGTNWQRKLFAGKLKEIVCLLIGCTMEQLEDNDFKEKELGEEWRVHYNWHYKLKNDTNPLGRAGSLYFIREESDNEMSNVTYNGLEHGTYILTPRLLLQYLGTDCGRNIIHPNIWINALFADYKSYATKGEIEYKDNPNDETPVFPDWIITDVRFPNEVKAIEDRGGVIIRINRNWAGIISKEDTHPSETSLDNHTFKYTINNDGNINQLLEMVETALKSLKIIL